MLQFCSTAEQVAPYLFIFAGAPCIRAAMLHRIILTISLLTKILPNDITFKLPGIRCEGEDWQKLGQLSSIDILNSHICELVASIQIILFFVAEIEF